MLQLNLSGPAQFVPDMPSRGSRVGATWPRPPTSALPPGAQVGLTPTACGYGYAAGPNGVCMSQGCFDGRSPCVVVDGYGRTCSYDQLLAFQAKSGVPSCGPAPALPAPPNAPSVNTPGFDPSIPVDVSPNPGAQITATVPIDQLVPSAFQRIPKWALVVGGLSIVAIVVSLLVRR